MKIQCHQCGTWFDSFSTAAKNICPDCEKNPVNFVPTTPQWVNIDPDLACMLREIHRKMFPEQYEAEGEVKQNLCRVEHYCDASCWQSCRFGVSAQVAYPDVTLSATAARECAYKDDGRCTNPDAIKEAE